MSHHTAPLVMSHDIDITVHHLHTGTSPSSPTSLLDRAHELVDAATQASRWRSVQPFLPSKSAPFDVSSRTVCYRWARAPPVIPLHLAATQRMPELEAWDAPFEEETDSFDLSTLGEFESVDFSEVLLHKSLIGKRKSYSRSPSPTRQFADNTNVVEPTPHSGRRLRSSSPPSYISISTLIPLPHYHESPDPARPPPPEIEQIPSFHISRGVSTTLPYARTAWIVPLRGCPPFEGASPAVLYPSTVSKPQGSATEPPHTPICIRWTPPAISQFWTFLLRQRDMNNFGPIALSYTLLGPFRPTNPKHSGSGIRRLWSEEDDQWEYIKIYHDAQYALKLRSLLDSFRWGDEEVLPDASRPNRVLKGACLVLMDERGDAMLLA